MGKRFAIILTGIGLSITVGAGVWAQATKLPVPPPAISAAAVLDHVKTLASDQYEGRAPGTRGEDLSIAYISDQFKKVGLAPGNPDGTYLQNVPMIGITPDPATSLTFAKGGATRVLKFRDDVVAWTKRAQPVSRARRWSCWWAIRRYRIPRTRPSWTRTCSAAGR